MVESNWPSFQDKVKARWSRLSGDRLLQIAGCREQLVSDVKEVYGLADQVAEQQVQDFERRNQDYRPWTSSCSKWRVV